MRILLLATLCLLLQSLLFSQEARVLDSLVIIHWNDFHAQNIPFEVSSSSDRTAKRKVGGSAVMAGYLREFRKTSPNMLAVSGGDEFQGTPISNFTSGRSQVEILNVIKPDAVVLGNHEFDYGTDSLRANLKRAEYPIICSNVVETRDNSTFGLPFVIKKLGNIKVGILGITSPVLYALTLKKNLTGVRLRDLDSSLESSLSELKKQDHPNLIVLLSHEGVDDDSVLALRHPEINVIIGAHDHRALFNPKKIRNSIIVEAGSKGQYLGRLALTVDLKGDSVTQFTDKLIEVTGEGIQPDSVVAAMVNANEVIVNKGLSEVIGELQTPWTKSDYGAYESNLGNYESDAFRTASGIEADIAFVNTAGIRKNLAAGPIMVRDIWEINPFGNTIVSFTVRGDTLRQMMAWQAGKPSLQVSGVKYSFRKLDGPHADLLSLEVDGKPVDDTKHYRIVTNNYVGEHFRTYFGFDPARVTITDTGLIDRDVVIDAVKRQKVITSPIEGRIQSVN